MTESGKHEELRGRRYIRWVRCSTKGQIETSIEDQLRLLSKFGDEHGLIHAGDAVLDGVSGLAPKVQVMAAELVRRKQEQNDFDVVLIHDFSRLTRAGLLDAAKIEYDFRANGIQLISILDNVPEGEFADVFKSFKHVAANQQSKAIALATTRGSMSAIQSGRAPHCHNAPYGTDRLVKGPNGQPRFLLRLLADGRQLKLDHQTHAVLEEYDRNGAGSSGALNHYRLQRGESVELVPGDPNHIAIVHRIYEWHHLRGWGDHLITKALNDEAVPSPRGGAWSTNSVFKMLINPIYLGRGSTNQTTTGRHFKRSKDRPLPAERTQEELSKYAQPPRRRRPLEEWEWVEQPQMAEFLPPELRRLAAEEQRQYRERIAGKKPKSAASHDRHRSSSYILKGLAVCSKTGLPLTGRTSSRGKKVWRYYALSRAYGFPSSGSSFPRNLCPAEPIESLVVQQLALVMRSMPKLRERLADQLRRAGKKTQVNDRETAALRDERQKLDDQMAFVVEELSVLGQEAGRRKLRELAARRERIDRQIAEAEQQGLLTESEIKDRVDGVMGSMRNAMGLIQRLGRPALIRLLRLLVGKIEVDLETRRVKIEFRLPSWAMERPADVCLALGHDSMSSNEADGQNGLLLRRCMIFWMEEGYWGYAVAA